MVLVVDDDLPTRVLHPAYLLSPHRLSHDPILPLGGLQGTPSSSKRRAADPLGRLPQAR